MGVAGFSETAGASSLAAGLAASLSETNDGKVLLVDANLGPEDVHPFFKGKPAYPLKSALKPSEEMTSAADNFCTGDGRISQYWRTGAARFEKILRHDA